MGRGLQRPVRQCRQPRQRRSKTARLLRRRRGVAGRPPQLRRADAPGPAVRDGSAAGRRQPGIPLRARSRHSNSRKQAMNTIFSLRRAVLAAALLLPLCAWTALAAALPGNSIYRLDATLTDATGQHFALHDMAGTPVLITMFYGDCHAACPVIIETLKRTVAALGADGKRLRVLMISLDPRHDTPA